MKLYLKMSKLSFQVLLRLDQLSMLIKAKLAMLDVNFKLTVLLVNGLVLIVELHV